jgi:hypothetical protein
MIPRYQTITSPRRFPCKIPVIQERKWMTYYEAVAFIDIYYHYIDVVLVKSEFLVYLKTPLGDYLSMP